eukprot:TRINITY_DN5390_c0_g2_i1.p1 TRINITY_DN5390_c0_g2~~TRINITY_DN5390_c0_g2_i1.p1  ORF type:complete len:677 (+),score=126.04 TRINITY_DN5390_c0_g2_i1:61-2091(+)
MPDSYCDELAQLPWELVTDFIAEVTAAPANSRDEGGRERALNVAAAHLKEKVLRAVGHEHRTARAELRQLAERIDELSLLLYSEQSKKDAALESYDTQLNEMRSLLDAERFARQKELASQLSTIRDSKIAIDGQKRAHDALAQKLTSDWEAIREELSNSSKICCELIEEQMGTVQRNISDMESRLKLQEASSRAAEADALSPHSPGKRLQQEWQAAMESRIQDAATHQNQGFEDFAQGQTEAVQLVADAVKDIETCMNHVYWELESLRASGRLGDDVGPSVQVRPHARTISELTQIARQRSTSEVTVLLNPKSSPESSCNSEKAEEAAAGTAEPAAEVAQPTPERPAQATPGVITADYSPALSLYDSLPASMTVPPGTALRCGSPGSMHGSPVIATNRLQPVVRVSSPTLLTLPGSRGVSPPRDYGQQILIQGPQQHTKVQQQPQLLFAQPVHQVEQHQLLQQQSPKQSQRPQQQQQSQSKQQQAQQAQPQQQQPQQSQRSQNQQQQAQALEQQALCTSVRALGLSRSQQNLPWATVTSVNSVSVPSTGSGLSASVTTRGRQGDAGLAPGWRSDSSGGSVRATPLVTHVSPVNSARASLGAFRQTSVGGAVQLGLHGPPPRQGWAVGQPYARSTNGSVARSQSTGDLEVATESRLPSCQPCAARGKDALAGTMLTL